MAYQPIPVTDAVQDRTTEKTIFSGSPFVSSILGTDAYKITPASAPVYYRSPVISGGLAPPSVLTCEAESYNASPRGTVTYQWKKDTVNITDETNPTYNTVLGDIGSTITCEVTATNPSGFDTEISNGLVMQAVTNTYIYELDIMPIGGLSGFGRMDINNADVHLIGGINVPTAETMTSADAIILTGIAQEDSMHTTESESYAITYPEVLSAMTILNGDAENSVMTDWTMDTGNVQSVTTATGVPSIGRIGSRFFKADDLGLGVDSQMSQEVAINAADYTDVDAGECYIIFSYRDASDEGFDKITVTLEAIDSGVTVLATAVYNPGAGPWDRWRLNHNFVNPFSIPTLTRKVKITVLFDARTTGSAANDAYADEFHFDLMKNIN
jgi:hypothetical protein